MLRGSGRPPGPHGYPRPDPRLGDLPGHATGDPSVLLQWYRVPTKEIVLIRETIPGPPPYTEVLATQKRKGSVTVLLDFFPTVAFFVARNETDFVRASYATA